MTNNNLIKNERNINRNNININQIKNNKMNYHIKLESIKNRMKDLLKTYNYLLRNKINLNVNEYLNNRNNNNNNQLFLK